MLRLDPYIIIRIDALYCYFPHAPQKCAKYVMASSEINIFNFLSMGSTQAAVQCVTEVKVANTGN